MKILEFKTKEEAESAVSHINDFAGEMRGFDTWDVPKLSPMQTWFITHPNEDVRLKEYKVPSSLVEKDLPLSWIPIITTGE